VSEDAPLILAVDTASSCSSVALTTGNVHNGRLLASLSLNSKLTHSRRLLSGIDWLLKENGVQLTDVDGLGVGLGPGSFTGLRIGMATMKGLATAMDKPLLGVSTLDGLACSCSGNTPLCALLDARKQEVYRRWYIKDIQGIYREDGSIEALSPTAFADEISEECQLVGDGVFVLGEDFPETALDCITIAPLPLHYINGASIGFLCCEQLQQNKIMDLESAVPLYVRASDAELSLQKKESIQA
jgi:tRNA threonylcarbamoyladenosine biosynthesis protein TsaB